MGWDDVQQRGPLTVSPLSQTEVGTLLKPGSRAGAGIRPTGSAFRGLSPTSSRSSHLVCKTCSRQETPGEREILTKAPMADEGKWAGLVLCPPPLQTSNTNRTVKSR